MSFVDHSRTHAETSDPQELSSAAYFTLIFLTISLFINYMDRFIIAILVQPIKVELQLSDSEVGLLTGLAFSVSLAICGVPVARWADRGSRKTIIGASMLIWSLLTALLGTCQTFFQFLLVRLGIGAAESGNVPPAQSMIADMFPPHRRASALGIFNAGASIGMILGFPLGALLENSFGWRGALLFVAAPGILFGFIFMWFVPEPRRHHLPRPAAQAGASSDESLMQVVRDLWKMPAYRQILLAHTASLFLDYGQVNWIAAFFERSFGTSRLEFSSFLTSTRGVGMLLGVLLGGFLADRLARKGLRGPTFVILFARSLLLFPTVAIYLSPDPGFAYAMAALSGLFTWMSIAPDYAILLTITPPNRRATANAVALVASSIIGMGGGPFLVGVASDLLTPHYGNEALRIALIGLSVVATLWCLIHYLLMAYHLRQHEKVAQGGGEVIGATI